MADLAGKTALGTGHAAVMVARLRSPLAHNVTGTALPIGGGWGAR